MSAKPLAEQACLQTPATNKTCQVIQKLRYWSGLPHNYIWMKLKDILTYFSHPKTPCSHAPDYEKSFLEMRKCENVSTKSLTF